MNCVVVHALRLWSCRSDVVPLGMTAGFSHRTTMIDNLHEVETVLALCGNSNCRQENDPPIRDLLPRDGFSRLRRTVYCGLIFSDSATTYDMHINRANRCHRLRRWVSQLRDKVRAQADIAVRRTSKHRATRRARRERRRRSAGRYSLSSPSPRALTTKERLRTCSRSLRRENRSPSTCAHSPSLEAWGTRGADRTRRRDVRLEQAPLSKACTP